MAKDAATIGSEELHLASIDEADNLIDLFYSRIQCLFNFLYYEEEKGNYDQYIAAMARRAKTHRAKDYRFSMLSNSVDEETISNRKQFSGSNRETFKKADQIKFQNIEKDYIQELREMKSDDVSKFRDIQIKILKGILKSGLEKCAAKISSKEVKEQLLRLEREFFQKFCPGSRITELFQILELPEQASGINESKFSDPKFLDGMFKQQLKLIGKPDRLLGCFPDARCRNFEPTNLQRQIMDSIDLKENTIVSAPSSSGKTMTSLYLICKMKAQGKTTVYLAPNKPLCNEFSLFAYNMELKFAIGTEDFFKLEELVKADVFICTPELFLKVYLSTYGNNNLSSDPFSARIGAAIFDELPHMFRNTSKIQLILLFAAILNWQTFALSASWSSVEIQFLQRLMNFKLIQQENYLRPTDMRFICSSSDSPKQRISEVWTSSLYSRSLIELRNDERLLRGIRVPITLDEFQQSHMSSKPPKSWSPHKLFTAADLTKFSLEYFEDLDDERWKQRESSNERLFSDKVPSPAELFKLLKSLSKSGCLPVLIFNDDPFLIDMYHQAITELLDSDLEIDKNSEKTAAASRQEKKAMKSDALLKGELASTTNASTLLSSPFGSLTETQMAEIFRHKPDRSGAEGTWKIKLGFRGRRVLASEYYHGLSLGIGIHHHGIDSSTRDAVESGLRLGFLRVVFCNHTMALGLNMPIKTVIFLGGAEEEMTPEKFIQCSGRAGRWGQDSKGLVMFLGYSWNQVQKIWDEIESPALSTPFLIPHLLMVAASPHGRSLLKRMSSYEIPEWEMQNDNVRNSIACRILLLQKLGLLDQNTELTDAGKVSLSLVDEGHICLFAGFVFSRYLERLRKCIQSSTDYMFVVSHFVRSWRATLKNDDDGDESDNTLTLANPALPVNQALRSLMDEVRVAALEQWNFFGNPEIFPPTEKITSLYVLYPDLTTFKATYSFSDLSSYVFHFHKKMKIFQEQASLPFDKESLARLSSD